MKNARTRTTGRNALNIGVAGLTATVILGGTALAGTAVKPYAVPLTNDYSVRALLSVGDKVQQTGGSPTELYQMIGIPDGLGATPGADGTIDVYMNHELVKTVSSEPEVGKPLNRGAFVSKFVLDSTGNVLSGDRAYDTIFLENTLLGPAPTAANSTPAFARFCSGSLAFQEAGFDRPIYFAGEESSGSATFDGRGGLNVAIFDNELHTLPKLGHLAWENSLVMPNTGNQTVIINMEDGPATPDSQLYMYVGTKDRSPGTSVLRRNGLDNGKLYTFAGADSSKNSEVTFTNGTIRGTWKEIVGAEGMTDVQLEAASDALGAFGFIRTEDGAFSKSYNRSFFFVTTGGFTNNRLGRAYQLNLNYGPVTGPASLQVVYNADQIVAAGGDIAISPDNIDTSLQYLVINEDGTADSRPVMASKNRDGSIWRIPLSNGYRITPSNVAQAKRVVELDPPGRDGVAVGPGVWETSGIIDTSNTSLGFGSFLFDVQAHSPTAAPAPNTVEDGQLLLMQGRYGSAN